MDGKVPNEPRNDHIMTKEIEEDNGNVTLYQLDQFYV